MKTPFSILFFLLVSAGMYGQSLQTTIQKLETKDIKFAEMQHIMSSQPDVPPQPISMGTKGVGVTPLPIRAQQARMHEVGNGHSVVVKPSTNPTMATITFNVVGSPLTTPDASQPFTWMQLNGREGDKAGFHMLLDGTGELVNWARSTTFSDNPWWTNWVPLYTMSQYTIPANASPDLTAPNFLNNGQASITVPPGTYDVAIVIPYSANRNRIFSAIIMTNVGIWGNEALIPDFQFAAGYEYIFTVSERDWIRYNAERDLDLKKIVIPYVSHNMTATEDVGMIIKNTGSVPVDDNIQLSYRINEGTWITETVSVSLAPGEQMTYTFNAKADFSALGYYTVEGRLYYAYDQWPLNNMYTARTKQVVPMTLPFFEGFSTQESIRWRGNWRVVDRNIVGAFYRGSETWAEHLSWRQAVGLGPDGTPGFVEVRAYTNDAFIGDTLSDDWLISNPINIPVAGDHHISFQRRTWPATHSLRILYGTSSNIDEMQVLADWPSIPHLNFQWRRMIANFHIETPGVYYFAFHYYAPIDVFATLNIDDIRIEAGFLAGTPDIEFLSVYATPSGCGMTEATIGLSIRNVGDGDIEFIDVSYQLAGSQSAVTQRFSPIPSMTVIPLRFDQKLDVSTPNVYTVTITAYTPAGNLSSNVIIRHHTPVTQLPFSSNFATSEIWNWAGEGWSPNMAQGFFVPSPIGSIAPGPLLSRCITLQPGVYRFAYSFISGISGQTDSHYAAVGKLGTDPFSWTPLIEFKDFETVPFLTRENAEFTFLVTEPGEYVIGFFQTSPQRSFAITNTSLSLVQIRGEHSVLFTDIASPTFPRLTPSSQTGGNHLFNVAIQNTGETPNESGTLELVVNDYVFGSQD
ncbi:MAG: DUF2436 domain-containing protein, partial [Bacteroidales bacterium]|nr:DUF2436 domain-containing protein [Bacteroidales bacterium]